MDEWADVVPEELFKLIGFVLIVAEKCEVSSNHADVEGWSAFVLVMLWLRCDTVILWGVWQNCLTCVWGEWIPQYLFILVPERWKRSGWLLLQCLAKFSLSLLNYEYSPSKYFVRQILMPTSALTEIVLPFFDYAGQVCFDLGIKFCCVGRGYISWCVQSHCYLSCCWNFRLCFLDYQVFCSTFC